MKKTIFILIATLFCIQAAEAQTYSLEYGQNDTLFFVQTFQRSYADGDQTKELSATMIVGADSMKTFLREKIKEQEVFLRKYNALASDTEARTKALKDLIASLNGTPKTPTIIKASDLAVGEYVWDGKSFRPKPAAETPPAKKNTKKKKSQ